LDLRGENVHDSTADGELAHFGDWLCRLVAHPLEVLPKILEIQFVTDLDLQS
jgi:hypothetical protein